MAMNRTKTRRPGDLILDHYMPNASEEEREAARANLKAYVSVVIEICSRLEREAGDKGIGANSTQGVESEA